MSKALKREVIFKYKASMAVFKRWAENGVISQQDLAALGTALAEKYDLSPGSIFLENDLLCAKTRANILENSEEPI